MLLLLLLLSLPGTEEGRRSIYIHFFGAGEVYKYFSGDTAGEVFIYTDLTIDIITLDIAYSARLGLCADGNTSLW